jgi:hypothetical protein
MEEGKLLSAENLLERAGRSSKPRENLAKPDRYPDPNPGAKLRL